MGRPGSPNPGPPVAVIQGVPVVVTNKQEPAHSSMDTVDFQEDDSHLSDHFTVLRNRKKMIFFVFLLGLSVAVYNNFHAVPVFQSTATVIIEKDRSTSSITGERDTEGFYSQTPTFATHHRLITFTSVIDRVIKSLHLDAGISEKQQQALEISPFKVFMSQLRENTQKFLNIEKQTLTPAERYNSLVEMIRSKISVQPLPDTLLLNISVKDKDPQMAADIANTVARQYIEFNLANRMESSKETMEWLNNELYSLRKNLEQDEKRFFGFKKESKVFSIEGKQSLATQKIADFNNKYLETRNKRVELDAKIAELERHMGNSQEIANVRSLISNPLIDSIYQKRINLEMEYSKLDKMYKSKHPKIIQIKGEIAKTDRRLAVELEKERTNLDTQRKMLIARENVLEKTIKEFEADALETSGKELEYAIFKRNVDISQNLYNALIERIKESDIISSTVTSNIRLVETAKPAIYPVSPNKRRTLMMGMMMGLAIGAGLAFLLEYMDQTLRTEDDFHHFSEIPVLSVIPEGDRSQTYGA